MISAGDVGAVLVDEGEALDDDAEQPGGRADAAQLRVGPRAVRADAAAAAGVRRHAVPLPRGLLQTGMLHRSLLKHLPINAPKRL